MELCLKWVHMARHELILRLDGALWLTFISKPPLTPKGATKIRNYKNKLVFFLFWIPNFWMFRSQKSGFPGPKILDFPTSKNLDFPASKKTHTAAGGRGADGRTDGRTADGRTADGGRRTADGRTADGGRIACSG